MAEQYALCNFWIFLICISEIIANFSPKFSLNEYDVYEGVNVRMRCEIKGAPCNPVKPYIHLEKLIQNQWEHACSVFRNGTYVPMPMSDDNTVKDRGLVEYSIANSWYNFYLNELNLKDNGNWRCALPECGNDTLLSDCAWLTINTDLNRDNIILTPPDYILLNTPNQYTCYSARVYPEANVTWTHHGETSEGISNNKFNQDGYFWEIENTNTFPFCDRDSMEVTCALSKTSGDLPWDVNNTVDGVPVYAPAVIENITVSNKRPNISETLTLRCRGSGTSHTISWYKDGSILEDDLFERSDVIEYGAFKCGETNATLSTLTWIQNDGFTCKMVTQHDGQYLCEVGAEKGGPARSESYNITALYPPLVPFSNVQTEAQVGETVNLTCYVNCSMPNDLTYLWMREETMEDLNNDNSSIQITITEHDFNTTIRCTVNNEVGGNFIRFTITEKQTTTTTTTTPMPTSDTTEYTETSEKPDDITNQALVTAFAVIWSLCGLFAILFICLALYHYRQIIKGKTYKGEYSEELVLTDDEAKPGISHGAGVYDDINPVVVGKRSVDGAIGGVTNEGLYAEVHTPIQTQMPVAPKRASKASHPHPGTPKTKRNQAPAEPKSSLNTQHQPNLPSTGRRPEPIADYSPVSNKKEMPPKHSHDSNHVTVSKVVQQKKGHEAPAKPAPVKQNTNGTKPSVPVKPDIQSFRSSRSSGKNHAGAPYDKAEVNLYANCDQRPEPKNGDGTITYADLALQQEDPYEEGAPPVPKKNMNDQEPVQYASIKRNK